MNRLIIVGSPRVGGRSARLAELLFEACIEECPDDEVALAPVSTLDIAPCEGCDACRALLAQREELSGGESEATDGRNGGSRCIVDDDMTEVYELLDAADELAVVAPVYFAGPSAQFKALLDRLQPYFWTDMRTAPKRSATLHVVGEGGDPHGFDPLVGIVRSALSVAGFKLDRVLDWVGRIDADGEIVSDAVERPLPPLAGCANDEDALSDAGDGSFESRAHLSEADESASVPRVSSAAAHGAPSRASAENAAAPRDPASTPDSETPSGGRSPKRPELRLGAPAGEDGVRQGSGPARGRSSAKRKAAPAAAGERPEGSGAGKGGGKGGRPSGKALGKGQGKAGGRGGAAAKGGSGRSAGKDPSAGPRSGGGGNSGGRRGSGRRDAGRNKGGRRHG